MALGVKLHRVFLVACVVALAGCGGASSGGTIPTEPSPASSFAGTTTQSVPSDGMLSFPIVANLGLQGTISFPLAPGAGGTGTLLFSSSTVDGLPPLAGPPLDPQLVEYLCVSFSVHQVPVAAPALSLTAAPSGGTTPTGVGLAYFQAPSNSWNESYGLTAFTPAVNLVARDAVYYRPDRTCFALYVTRAVPLPA